MCQYVGWLPFEIPSRRATYVDLLVDMNQIGGWFNTQNCVVLANCEGIDRGWLVFPDEGED